MLELDYFESSSGRAYAAIFFERKTTKKAQIKIDREMGMLKKYGLEESLKVNRVKKIVKNPTIFELRVRYDGIFYRFPFLVDDKNTAHFLDGFKKKTNQTEDKDIERAKSRAKEFYQKQMRGGEK